MEPLEPLTTTRELMVTSSQNSLTVSLPAPKSNVEVEVPPFLHKLHEKLLEVLAK